MAETEIVVTRAQVPFVMVPLFVLELSPQAVKLYGLLWRYADNSTREAWPSRPRLAADMGFKQARSVDAIVKELEDAGAVDVIRRKAEGVNLPNRYHLNTEQRGSAVQSTTVVQSNAKGSAVQSTRVVLHTAPELEPLNYNHEQEPLLPLAQAEPRTSRKATQVPDPFVVTEELVDWAKMETPLVNQALETPKFVDYHKSKGSTFKDWTAAWRNWMRNAQAYAARDRQATGARVPTTQGTSQLGLKYDDWD